MYTLPDDPPVALVLMLAVGYHEHGHDGPVRNAIEAAMDLHARLGFLKYALLPGPASRADVALLSVLLETQMQLGDQAGVGETLAHLNLRIEPNDTAFIRAMTAVRAAALDATIPLEPVIVAVQTFTTQERNLNRDLTLLLTLAAVATTRGHYEDTLSLVRRAFTRLEIPNHFASLDKDYVTTQNASQTSSWGVALPGTAEALAFLDTLIGDDRLPVDVRGTALLLRVTGDPSPTSDMTSENLEQARAWLGDTLWVRSLMTFDHPLAYIRHKRAWAADVVAVVGSEAYIDWVMLPTLPEGEHLSRDETLELHALLTQWPEAFEEGEARDYMRQLRDEAWAAIWEDALKAHGLHGELVRAAQLILEDNWAGSEDVRRAALFTIGYHADAVGTPAILEVAADAYEQYLAAYGRSYAVLNNLGSVWERQGKFQQADEFYREALGVQPNSELTQRNLRRVQPPGPLDDLRAQGIRLRFTDTVSDADREVTLAYWGRTLGGWTHTLKALSSRYGQTNAILKTTAGNSGWAYAVNHTCADCEKELILTGRQAFDDLSSSRTPWVCRTCMEKRERERKAQQVQVHQRQVETIRRMFDLSDIPAVTAEMFTFEDAVFLVTLVRHAGSEDLRVIASLAEQDPGLAPTPEFAAEMVKRLHERGLLRVHPASAPDAFTWDGDHQLTAFTWTKVRWGVPMGGQQLPFGPLVEALEAHLCTGPGAWPTGWVVEVDDVGRRTVLHEALRYLRHSLAEYHLEFSPGEKTHQVLRTLLETYSLAQTWSIIWSSAKNAAAYYQKGGVSKAQAANSVVGRMQRHAERAQAEGWSVHAARRDFDTPMPVVSSVLFTLALGLGVRYQELRPADWIAAASNTIHEDDIP